MAQHGRSTRLDNIQNERMPIRRAHSPGHLTVLGFTDARFAQGAQPHWHCPSASFPYRICVGPSMARRAARRCSAEENSTTVTMLASMRTWFQGVQDV